MPLFLPPAYNQPVEDAPTPKQSREGSDPGVRMISKARDAAARLGLSTSDIAATLENPDEVGADDRDSSRMVVRKGKVAVIVARDGMVLSVRRG